ncbi:MAG: metallophosphoesterase [Magnetococcales bacterium]|nr:metallophosphoesterase [Magnetococcales bacterium]
MATMEAEASGLWDRFKRLVGGSSRSVEFVDLARGEMFILNRQIQVPFNGVPIELTMGKPGKKLLIYPDPSLDTGLNTSTNRLIIIDPNQFFYRISGFLTLNPNESILLGAGQKAQQSMFQYPGEVSARHLSISYSGGVLTFRDFHTGCGTTIRLLREHDEINRLLNFRLDSLYRIREIFGGPIKLFPRVEALTLLEEVNAILAHEKYRRLNDQGKPGGLMVLPDYLTPIFIGDLHTKIDNLLKVLSENSFLEALEEDKACLVIMGDAVHSEVDGQLEEMGSSLLIMDFIFQLKVRFPHNVFYLRGNHDSFSPEIHKSGVSQGMLWEKTVRFKRGAEYKEQMDLFYQQLPVVVMGQDFIACHAAPPMQRVKKDDLVNLYEHPRLLKELTWYRIKRNNSHVGYAAKHVRQFRQSLSISSKAILIVAHNPLSRETDTHSYWLHAEDIPNHHILFSGLCSRVAVMTRIHGKIRPLEFPMEPLVEFINKLPERAR